jgi:hypothetical protein
VLVVADGLAAQLCAALHDKIKTGRGLVLLEDDLSYLKNKKIEPLDLRGTPSGR